MKNFHSARLIQVVKRNVLIQEDFHAALSLGGRNTAVPFTLLGLVGTATPQKYSADRFTSERGGGSSCGGRLSLNGVNGQPDANSQPMSGENSSFSGGLWSLFAVQTPDAPPLTIRLTSPSTAVILWPSPSAEFTLQQNSHLNKANWEAAPQTVGDNGVNRFIIVDPLVGNRFYRLFKL
jgi:hypothetical protein